MVGTIVAGTYAALVELVNAKARTARLSAENDGLKRNVGVFRGLAARQSPFSEADLPPGAIKLGNSEAQFRLVSVLSAGCAPCGSKLRELRKLADWFEDGVGITVLVKNEEECREVVQEVVQLAVAGDFEESTRRLERWYELLARKRARGSQSWDSLLEEWRRRSPMSGERLGDVESVYSVQEEWFKGRCIPQTPFIALNGQALPAPYYDMEILRSIIETTAELDEGV
jgi:hypothetical protein